MPKELGNAQKIIASAKKKSRHTTAANRRPSATHAEKETPKTIPAIYISDNPVGLDAWRSGKNSPNPRPARQKH